MPRHSSSSSHRLPEGFPFCRHGRTAPRNAWLVRPSPCRIGSYSGPANCWVSLSYHPCLPFCLSHCKQQGSLSPRALPRFIDTMNPSYSLSSSATFPVFPVIWLPCSADFSSGRGGSLQLLSVSLSSCCRFNPARVNRRVSQSADDPCCLRSTEVSSTTGATASRGQICVHFRYGPMTCSPS